MASSGKNGDRVAVVTGLRTPFLKQGTGFRDVTTLELSTQVVGELVQRTGVDPKTYTLCVFGQVMPSLDYINIAREVVLRANLDRSTESFSVSRACATSMQALTSCIESIEHGEHDAAIAGGADSMDDLPLGVSKRLTVALMGLQKAKTMMARLKLLSGISPKDLVPPMPGYSVEPTTGLSMGQSAEKMVKENGISRVWQDEIAFRSHSRAAKAWAEGFYDDQVMPIVVPPFKEGFREDNLVRKDSKLEDYASLKPAYDRAHGTITPGNASPLTDGAAALTVMKASKAKALGLEPLGYVRSWAYAGVDPNWQLLMAPVFAVPMALKRAGLTMKDIGLVEMHEAFAAQVASNLQALASKKFCEDKLGLSEAIGEIDPEILNVNGGSIALGHPFGATGARIVLQGLKALKKRGKQFGLMTICTGGAMGVAAVLEVA
ncbi:MAG: acetyl-CoA C-acyltransferase FadI [Deltaproteobacteria bacterium]|nr:acetyl-CoA C-acyltransferase FadI [Deltaproteobacteria bacterium]